MIVSTRRKKQLYKKNSSNVCRFNILLVGERRIMTSKYIGNKYSILSLMSMFVHGSRWKKRRKVSFVIVMYLLQRSWWKYFQNAYLPFFPFSPLFYVIRIVFTLVCVLIYIAHHSGNKQQFRKITFSRRCLWTVYKYRFSTAF